MVAIFTRLRHSHDPPGDSDESDAVLVRRALREREAFAALYLRYLDEIARFCCLRLGDVEAARDATQQIFAQALAALPRYQERDQFRAWLYTIARHVLANHARQRRATSTLEAAMAAVDPGQTPEELASAALERRALLAAVASLPEDQRLAVELRLAGLTGPEVAETMGRSHDAVKKLQFRAVQRLRAELAAGADEKGARRGT